MKTHLRLLDHFEFAIVDCVKKTVFTRDDLKILLRAKYPELKNRGITQKLIYLYELGLIKKENHKMRLSKEIIDLYNRTTDYYSRGEAI